MNSHDLIGALGTKLTARDKEVARLKAALERIANDSAADDHVRAVARRALNGEGQ